MPYELAITKMAQNKWPEQDHYTTLPLQVTGPLDWLSTLYNTYKNQEVISRLVCYRLQMFFFHWPPISFIVSRYNGQHHTKGHAGRCKITSSAFQLSHKYLTIPNSNMF